MSNNSIERQDIINDSLASSGIKTVTEKAKGRGGKSLQKINSMMMPINEEQFSPEKMNDFSKVHSEVNNNKSIRGL